MNYYKTLQTNLSQFWRSIRNLMIRGLMWQWKVPGNIKMSSCQYKDPMINMIRYDHRLTLLIGIPYLERQPLYWNRARVSFQTPTCYNCYQHICNADEIFGSIQYKDAALPISNFSLQRRKGCETVLWWDFLYWLYGIFVYNPQPPSPMACS